MSIRETSCLNIVLQAGEAGRGGGGTSGQLNVFIPERQMSLDQAILQGEDLSLVEPVAKVHKDFTIMEKEKEYATTVLNWCLNTVNRSKIGTLVERS